MDQKSLAKAVGSSAPTKVATNESVEGAIVGFRDWRLLRHVITGDFAIGSPIEPVVWYGPTLSADRHPLAEVAPHIEPGVYAHTARDIPPVGRFQVRGRVLLHGTVCEHERGYRAERAIIDQLCLLYTPERSPTGGTLIPAMFYEIMEGSLVGHDGFGEVVTSGVGHEQAREISRSLERRYDCRVFCLELTHKELERAWTSVE